MRISVIGLSGLFIIAACSSSSSHSSATDGGGSHPQADTGTGSRGHDSGEGTHPGDPDAGDHDGGSTQRAPDAATTVSDSGAFPAAGNQNGSCSSITPPSETKLVDTSSPTTVVGTGAPASCDFAALTAAVTKGGIITFNCGPDPVTIPLTTTLTPPTSNAYASQPSLTIVIDGGDKVTLDGQGAVRLIEWVHTGSWQKNQDTLTLQRIRLVNGKTTPTEKIPSCPPANGISNATCSTGYDDGQGGALFMQDGNLRVINCIFENNTAALLGPDTGGGAIYMYGTGSPSFIMQSSFLNNKASNAGAIGLLWAGATIINSLFEGNSAVGTGANDNDATMCTCSNMGNNYQTGSGGNGGAIYKDGGDGMTLTICGDEIKGNSSVEFGAAIFLTADGSGAKLVIDDSDISGNNQENAVWQWCTGVSTDNPHSSTGGSPSPINTSFCDENGANCKMTCGS